VSLLASFIAIMRGWTHRRGVNQIADIPVLRDLSGGDRFDQECVSSIPPAPVPVENLIRLVKDRESGDAAGS
jgi:hypothetical protein